MKLVAVMALTCVSAAASAEVLVTLSERAPAFSSARAEAAVAANPAPVQPDAPAATIAKSGDGHYWAQGQVNGASVRFLVDTGATAVALTPEDAKRLGFSPADLNYTYKVVTAGGQARAAAVKLASVSVGGARLDNVDALVIDRGLDTSLLGMSYLGRLASFQATRQALILQP
ncbi:MAG: TIGR02281 family clan AA aspartic protease [Phenylobacterium sp.]